MAGGLGRKRCCSGRPTVQVTAGRRPARNAANSVAAAGKRVLDVERPRRFLRCDEGPVVRSLEGARHARPARRSAPRAPRCDGSAAAAGRRRGRRLPAVRNAIALPQSVLPTVTLFAVRCGVGTSRASPRSTPHLFGFLTARFAHEFELAYSSAARNSRAESRFAASHGDTNPRNDYFLPRVEC